MKKIIFLFLSTLFINFTWSQANQAITITTSSSVEVGIDNNFEFKFIPKDYPSGSTSYKITSWHFHSGDANMNNTGFNSYIDTSLSSTSYGINQSQILNFPIKWEDNSNYLTDNIFITAFVDYYKTVNGSLQLLGSQTYPHTYTVNINRIFPPTISTPAILNCCTSPITFTATNYGTADVFNWTVSGGTYSGSGSSITVTPNVTGSVTVACVVKRSTGLLNYTRTNSVTVNRTARTASFTAVYNSTPSYDYICKGSGGRQMSMPTQCGISTINWVAPSCTISGQGTLTPTITPLSSIPTGSTINIYAVVTFTSGCTATTPSVPFKILDSTVAPQPDGYFTVEPNTGDICTAEIFELTFHSTDGFNNGVTTFSPQFLWGPGDPIHYRVNKPTKVTVCNKNICTGQSTCKVFTVYPPAPCDNTDKMLSSNSKAKLIITPNPTSGNINVTLPESLSGSYQIFDKSNSVLVQEGKFDNKTNFQIELFHKLKAGIYILKINTDNNYYTENLIINK